MTHWKGEKWLGTTTVEEYLSKLTLQKLGKADIALFIGNGHADAQFGGSTPCEGCICNENVPKKKRLTLNLWWTTAANLGLDVAHEIGHGLGMEHDFGRPDKRTDCGKGIMNYPPNVAMKWSICSKDDFAKSYKKNKKTWCMPEDETACKTD